MVQLTIEAKETEAAQQENKSNVFSATLLAYLLADNLWEGGQTKTNVLRPVYLAVGGTEAGIRPFVANLRAGRKARAGSHDSLELLKSGEYLYSQQHADRHTLYHIYQPELFCEDPGLIDPDICSFISAPSSWWIADIRAAIRVKQPGLPIRVDNHLHALGLDFGPPVEDLIPIALHFCNHLDHRTGRPLVNDVAFRVQLYQAAIAGEYAHIATDRDYISSYRRDEFTGYGLGRLGIRPTAFHMTHPELDAFLTRQVQVYQGVCHT